MEAASLQRLLEQAATLTPQELEAQRGDLEPVLEHFLRELSAGRIRAAFRDADGQWHAVAWVKQGILLCFRLGQLREYGDGELWSFVDVHTLPVRRFRREERVRIVPGGSAVRVGAYVAPGVICMPPMYINVGAYVDEGTLVDSHALVGSCAQIGRRVHLSAGVQIGGVLEPPAARPVIVEDEAFIGANSVVVEGVLIRRRAVVAAGVVLTATTPVYDLVRERVLSGTPEAPVEIPEGAVVVPGVRALSTAYARAHGLGIATPLIVKYRDARTDARAALEGALRQMFNP
jgi:2,3,4,5-tetrahydropyridine-2-carboxylate N-succinyltransferase